MSAGQRRHGDGSRRLVERPRLRSKSAARWMCGTTLLIGEHNESPWTRNRLWQPHTLWPRSQRLVRVPPFSSVRKGTHAHRAIGTVYVLALVLVNVAALSLHRENTFGVFHGLAVVSLVTIAVGISPFLLGKRSPAGHRYPRVLHDVVIRWGGCGRLRTTSRRCWSGRWRLGCPPLAIRNGVVHQRRRHLRESPVSP